MPTHERDHCFRVRTAQHGQRLPAGTLRDLPVTPGVAGLDDGRKVGMLRLPVQHPSCLACISDQTGRIAGRRAASRTGTGRPVTASTCSITWRTEYPRPLPRLSAMLS